MIDVKNLVKKYAGQTAVQGISFEVSRGEVVGFLGPNGAGKSTTMRILTGFLPPTSGDVTVAGLDLLENSREVRRKIGYMPENVPLYMDMRVREYVEYRAALKGIRGRALRNRVSDALARCGVADVSRKMIGALSRGYRQRVGLADAIVHDPELLILDEPTAGLDPNQIRTVRELIKDLAKDRTILLSTHILPEVEMVCSRAIIINRGKIEASDTLENLAKRVRSGSLFLEVQGVTAEVKAALEALEDVGQVEVRGEKDGWVQLECLAKPGKDVRRAVDDLIKDKRWPLHEFRYAKPTLEDVFVELTQE
ncbi:MAG: gliding motility-associated ABC transporter ATP-binding subunit GldA [Candidatus Methylacidiphilales bacterium]